MTASTKRNNMINDLITSSTSTFTQQPTVVAQGRFQFIRKVGAGSYGEIYQGLDLTTNEPCAIKIEPRRTEDPELLAEAEVAHALHSHALLSKKPADGIPRVLWSGVDGDYNMMMLQLLGPSLEDLFTFCGKKFSITTAATVVSQMIDRVAFMHCAGYIHRDLGPHNFLMGCGKQKSTVFIIDFGFSTTYRHSDLTHILPEEGTGRMGTAAYCSINAHNDNTQSRRDDLEALAHILIYFLKGELPWEDLTKEDGEEDWDAMLACKKKTQPRTLCKGLPKQVLQFLTYTRQLSFTEDPDYTYLQSLLSEMSEAAEEQKTSKAEGENVELDWDRVLRPAATREKVKSSQPANDEKKQTAKGRRKRDRE